MIVGKLYTLDLSPPARAVLLTGKALNIEFEQIFLNFFKGEHRTEDFEKMNPQHTVPTFIDLDGTVVWDSHAIIAYLVGKYGKDDSLYPKDLAKRAVVDQRLHFDSGNLFANLKVIVFPMWNFNEKGPNERQRNALNDQYAFLNKFVSDQPWMAGESVTIADLSIISTVTSLQHLHPIDEQFTNLLGWIKRCEALPYYDVNIGGAKDFGDFVRQWVIPPNFV